MHGFLIPLKSRRIVLEEKGVSHRLKSEQELNSHDITDDPILCKLVAKDRLYGTFVEREGIMSSMRLVHREDGQIRAVLFVNFDKQIVRFPSSLRRELVRLKKEMTRFLPIITNFLQGENTFPLKRLLRVLQSAQEHLDVSFEANLRRILRSAMEVANLNKETSVGTVHAYDGRSRSLRLVAAEGKIDPGVANNYRELKVKDGHGIVSWVALRRSEILIDDIDKSEFKKIYIPTRRGVRSLLTVPILSGGERLAGVLNLESTKPRAFAPQCLRAIWCIANQGAAVYRPAEMMQNLLRICSEAPDRVGQPHPLNDLAELVRKYLRGDMCDIWYADPDNQRFEAVGLAHASSERGAVPRVEGEGWTHYVRHMREPILINNIKSETEFTVQNWNSKRGNWRKTAKEDMPSSINALLLKLNVCEELAMPIIAQGQCVGVLWLMYRRPGETPSSQEEMTSLFGFAGEIAMVLMSLHRQGEFKLQAANEGMISIIRAVQHDMVGSITARIFVEIDEILKNGAAPTIQILVEKLKRWQWLLNLQRETVAHLRLFAEGLMGTLALSKEEVSLSEVVDRAILGAEILQKTPHCKNEVSRDLKVDADRIIILLVLINLIHNAKKYTPAAKLEEPVIVSATKVKKENQERILVSVDDGGDGVPQDLVDKLYVQHGAHVKGFHPASGSGTGLFLCAALIHAHGGEICKPVKNQRGGARFSFSLPLT
jgi:GAF domain-containing protein